jgi:hypothetical protein
MPGASAFRGIAGDIEKIALFIALRACVRRRGSRDEKSALGTFPIRLVALWTDIPFEFSIGGIAAERTRIFFFCTSHYFTSFYKMIIFIWKSRQSATGCRPDQILIVILYIISFPPGLSLWR